MTARVTVALVALVLAAGCLVGPLDDIPCAADDECPSDYFCDLGHDLCVLGDADTGPPNLQIVAVETPDGEKDLTVSVPREESVKLLLDVENKGQTAAEFIELELSEYHAIQIQVRGDSIPERIDGKKKAQIAIDVFVQDDSSSPVPFDWFLSFSGRQRRGVFTLVPERIQTPD